ncbi:MAG TPA: hypothetical protein PLL75_00255 [Candidatus Omnitrophota bacterium]|nr:hypothetical protein [Candidatus Omnitrophota bacterium]HPS36148.1 hypothetical protein [Candidatus Omnitrophota bacterium]
MENGRKSGFFIFFIAFLMAFSVVALAEEADETTPDDLEDQYREEPVPASQEVTLAGTETPVTPSPAPVKPPVSEPVVAATAPVVSQPEAQAPVASSEGTSEKQAPGVSPEAAAQEQALNAVEAAAPVAPAAAVAEKTVAVAPVKAPAVAAPVQTPALPSGLVEIGGYKYPVYMFVPREYQADRTYSMIMVAPAKDVTAQDQIEYLSKLASRRNVFILAPYVLWPKSGTVPYTLDEWLLSVKNDVLQRYPINKKRVFLLGKDSGAEYAAYLATKYPAEFSGVALLGQAWDGTFAPLVHPQSGAANQMPFYIALKEGSDAKARNQQWLDKFQKDGYSLHLVEYQKDEDLTPVDFKQSVLDWLESSSDNWASVQAKDRQGWKGKLKTGVKNFFAV